MSARLEASGLCKSFHQRRVVDELALSVDKGEIVGLLGPNGAGKTTTFKMLLGLLRPDAGSVHFGRSLDGLPLYKRARAGLGYLPQGRSILAGLSVRDNLLAFLEALCHPNPRGRADELLARFGLGAAAEQKASTLSGGEQRKLEIARALTACPTLLLCDEPFAGVDPIAAASVAALLAELRETGVGVLLTDHNVREALSVCDRVYLIAAGRVVEHGTPETIRRSELARRLYLGESFA